MATPYPGAGPKLPDESYELVWSGNYAAVIGAVICLLLLHAWFKHVAPSLDRGEEDEIDG